jgi:hypothetical protein
VFSLPVNRIFRAVGCAACLLGLLATLGGHWLVFQSFAWASMIVNFSHQGSLTWAISRTFDGLHPCVICISIQQGRQEEQAENKKLPSVKPDETPTLWCAPGRMVLSLPSRLAAEAIPFVPGWYFGFLEPPPTPPPRAA